MTGYSRKSTKTVILFAVLCILLKLFSSILFPYANILLKGCLIIFIIYMVFFCIRNFKNIISKKYYINILIFIITVTISCLPIYKEIELSRFYLLKNAYNSLAKQVVTEIADNENTIYGEYDLHFPQQLITLNNKKSFFIKDDSDIVIGITVSESFFVRRDFVYFSSLQARELIENDDKYDSFEWLEYPHWAYVKWY